MPFVLTALMEITLSKLIIASSLNSQVTRIKFGIFNLNICEMLLNKILNTQAISKVENQITKR